MQPSNALQQMLKAPHAVGDPGNGKYIHIDRDRLYVSLLNSTAGSETRTFAAPPTAGLVAHVACTLCASGSIVVTVKNSSGGTATITFSAAGQWIGLVSVELTTGVFSWQATDVYGCTTTVQTAQNWSAAVADGTMTYLNVSSTATVAAAIIPALSAAAVVGTNVTLASNITALTGVFKSIDCTSGMTANALTAGSAVVSTNLTVRSLLSASSITAAAGNITALSAANIVLGTNITVGSMMSASSANIASNLQANSILATNVSVGAGLTANAVIVGTGGVNQTLSGGNTVGLTTGISGGSTQTLAVVLPLANLVGVSVTGATGYVKMPAAAVGLRMEVINIGSNAFTLCNNNTTNSCGSATLLPVAATNAAAAAADLWCDGTRWYAMR